MCQRPDNFKRNIIFFGEVGTGKSSVINLLLNSATQAPVSNDSRPCTQTSARYETSINGRQCILWDTRGLGEARSWVQFILGGGSENELKRFLKERHLAREIDLLVYCVRGLRATASFVNYYNTICSITRRLAAPVAIVATHLEREPNMEDWWTRNSRSMQDMEMVFDGHACITTLSRDPRGADCRKKLSNLITKDYRWEAKERGFYFGSPVEKSISATSTAPRKVGITQSVFKGPSVDEEILSRSSSNQSSTSQCFYSAANSPIASALSSPIEPPTPRPAASPIRVPRNIDTNLSGSNDPPQPSSDETPSTKCSLYSMFNSSPHSSYTSPSEAHLEPCTEDKEVVDYYFSELPFRPSTATIKRKEAFATRSGAYGDIWECDLVSGVSSHTVAVKAIRTNSSGSQDARRNEKNLRRELKIWGRLQHRNIVPLLGIVSGFGRLPSPVSPWFRNGSLAHHIAHRRLSMSDKHRLLGDVAVGLCYLHDQNIVHGDLHSDNVLIDDDGTACLTDFGLSIIRDSMSTSYLKGDFCGVIYFADPAAVKRTYISRDEFLPTKPSDVYSFGGIMVHVLSGKKPYDGMPTAMVIVAIVGGERPQIPIHNDITRSHKSFIEMCWRPEEDRRPSAYDLRTKFART